MVDHMEESAVISYLAQIHRNTLGALTCTPCPAGLFTNTPGSFTCTACTPGSWYSPQPGRALRKQVGETVANLLFQGLVDWCIGWSRRMIEFDPTLAMQKCKNVAKDL